MKILKKFFNMNTRINNVKKSPGHINFKINPEVCTLDLHGFDSI